MIWRTVRVSALSLALSVSLSGWASAQSAMNVSANTPQLADHPIALTHAQLVVRPGEVIEAGTLVMQAGRIVAVGASVRIPAGATVIDLAGKTVFAGFIDANSSYSQAEVTRAADASAPLYHWSNKVHPEQDATETVQPDAALSQRLRGMGFTSVLAQPDRGVFRGQAALLSTAGASNAADSVIATRVAQSIAFETNSNSEPYVYPVSSRATIALIRQTLLDVDWQQRQLAWQARNRDAAAIAAQPALSALAAVVAGRQPAIFQAPSELDFGRAARIAEEFKLDWLINGNGNEYRYVSQLKRWQARVIVPLTWPKPPAVADADLALAVPLAAMESWEWAPYNARVLAEAGVPFALTAAGLEKPETEFWTRVRHAVSLGLDERAALAALTVTPASMLGLQQRLGTLTAKQLANLVVADADLFRSGDASIYEVWIKGQRYQTFPVRERAHSIVAALQSKPALPPHFRYPAGEYGRLGIPAQPAAVIVRNATVWTQGPQGVLTEADLLIERGRIRAVGKSLAAPSTATVIDATGMHVTPGLIDTHSHTAVDLGRVWGDNVPLVTAEVRVRDVLDPTVIPIYRMLAGGLTTALVLPGSGTQMVGQGQTIKHRWGGDADDLPLDGAACAMKSAIGDNATMYNWGSGQRYPHTRMAIMDPLRDAFNAARAYEARSKLKGAAPLRRDLRMEAVLDVLSGKCIMQVHSGRQDDISAFIALSREYGIVPVFHHAPEAYKIADELASIGAGAAVAPDWWGLKMEHLDDVPYSAALLTQQGVRVSIHSDASEPARRFNTEAAKAIKYGGLSEVEAMNLVTINSARQLGAGERVGSLEVGKDADFVLWNAHPLSTFAIAQQTWIDGRRYFDRQEDLRERARIASERERLIARIKEAR
ncbi:amidohydrolase family protein [Steroidobacter sp.]|uniref:amidohydrolase family protein n=1 Tax=Steroidobacter sp. TaxID=1978227 RepID=UPI001A45ED20|nr:amidohydrolase family protein [Steroidobacter sp.]MBL8267814.1 amidohydrolase family protein [Steroidobacter sp.]